MARLADLSSSGTYTSDLSVAEHNAIHSVGFRPVGQVMGASVFNISYSGSWRCGYMPTYGGYGYRGGYGMQQVGWNPGGVTPLEMAPLSDALDTLRHQALSRMLAECTALGGDGVVGVTVRFGRFAQQPYAIELELIGTAVAATGDVRSPQPFGSDLSGEDFAKLVMHGWVPCGLLLVATSWIRHDDWLTRSQESQLTTSNVEITGHSELIHAGRHAVRQRLATDASRMGADGVVVANMTMNLHEKECSNGGGQDHVVEVSAMGTAIARFTSQRRAARQHRSPAVLPLRPFSHSRSPGQTGPQRGPRPQAAGR
jgi:uncharacterized protein YbjQ (UPF0145 family)